MTRKLLAVVLGSAAAVAGSLSLAPAAQADDLGFIINTTLGPGTSFPNGQAALDYGHNLCDQLAGGVGYPALATQIKNDFGPNEYKVSYLLSQATEMLCPAQIWWLRESAAGYKPTGEIYNPIGSTWHG